MPTLRIASANGEWMNSWFTPDGTPAGFVNKFKLPGETHSNVTTKAAGKLAALIRAIDPDVLGLEEAPSRQSELDLFISTYLSNAAGPLYAGILGDSGGAQKLALLYKPTVVSAALAPSSTLSTLLDPWEADVQGLMVLAPYNFTRVPLVVDVTAGTQRLQVIVMHTKSSFVNQGEAMWNDPMRRQDYVVAALLARRRNAAEGLRTRKYLDEQIAANPSARFIVMGDLNDGPGMDYFEEKYLAHNTTDVLIGSAFAPELVLGAPLADVPAANRYTAVFDDFVPTKVKNRKLLLDHLLLSPGLSSTTGLRVVAGSGTVHHTEWNAQVTNNAKWREDRPTDHRPVSVQLKY